MGCDIHMSYQKVSKRQKRENTLSELLDEELDEEYIIDEWEYILDGPWYLKPYCCPVIEGYQFCSEYRNYYCFGRLSEVRGDGPRITKSGFPDGVFDILAVNDYDSYHSHSHIYLDELVNTKWSKIDIDRMSIFINEIENMKNYCDSKSLKYSEFRILIKYDS